MKKISLKNIFKKSGSAKGGQGNKALLILLLILLVGAIIYLGYPILFPKRIASTRVTPSPPPRITVSTPASSSTLKTEETVVPEKTPFDMEMEKRKQAYEEKIFVYEPYQPPSYRNPFQRVSTYSSEPEVAKVEEEEEAWWKQIAIYKPELPPKTKLNGIVGSEKNRIAMIEMDGETFIAKLYDILLDKYIVKEIRKDEVILEVDDYEFSLKIGGEEASNE